MGTLRKQCYESINNPGEKLEMKACGLPQLKHHLVLSDENESKIYRPFYVLN